MSGWRMLRLGELGGKICRERFVAGRVLGASGTEKAARDKDKRHGKL